MPKREITMLAISDEGRLLKIKNCSLFFSFSEINEKLTITGRQGDAVTGGKKLQ